MIASASKRSTAHHAGGFMPTREQLIASYKRIADAALSSGKAKALAHAPANAQKFPSYSISRGVDMTRTVHVIKGQLYLENRVCGMQHWFKLGPAPMF